MKLRDLVGFLFGTNNPRVGSDFREMLRLIVDMFQDVDAALWSGEISDSLREEIFDRDIAVNQMERSIRKEVLIHLALGDKRDLAFCFVLINVVKDAERIGDNIKNMIDEVVNPACVQGGELAMEIRSLGTEIGQLLERVGEVFAQSNEQEAEMLVRQGRELAARCDELVRRVAASGYESGPTTCLVLATRFYKRIVAHATNILTAVIMPAHKIDFFDEEELGVDR